MRSASPRHDDGLVSLSTLESSRLALQAFSFDRGTSLIPRFMHSVKTVHGCGSGRTHIKRRRTIDALYVNNRNPSELAESL